MGWKAWGRRWGRRPPAGPPELLSPAGVVLVALVGDYSDLAGRELRPMLGGRHAAPRAFRGLMAGLEKAGLVVAHDAPVELGRQIVFERRYMLRPLGWQAVADLYGRLGDALITEEVDLDGGA